jgi:deoxyhypusine synthase
MKKGRFIIAHFPCFYMRKVNPLKISKDIKVSELVEGMKGVGFGAGKIAEASEILKNMIDDKECRIFLGVAGAMVPAGMKNILLDLLNDVDIFVTTGANLTHDLIEALGDEHFILEESMNDEELNKQGLDRIYNVVMQNFVYEKLEKFFEENWEKFVICKTIKEFLMKIGEILSEKGVENSLFVKCFKNKIHLFCPALADSGIGLMVWGRKVSGREIKIDAFEDMKEIIDFAWSSKKKGVVYVGGGVPKNFIQQSLQFSKGADYGIQITTDRQEPGGSSGAPLIEGVSWGKMNANAKFVDVFCDATIALPLIVSSVKK